MKKIKLTDTQQKSFKSAGAQLEQARNAQRMVQDKSNTAANHFDTILAMIGEAHGIDFKAMDPTTKLNLDNDGYLTVGENGKASDRIKKSVAIKTPAKKVANGKHVNMKAS